MAVARARKLEPLEPKEMEIGHNVLVIGGGIAGLETAIQLARRDYGVFIIEKEEHLGGISKQLHSLYPSAKPGESLIQEKLKEIYERDIKIFTQTEIENISGYVGNFKVSLKSGDSQIAPPPLEVGAIVLATGFQLYQPEEGEYGFLRFPNVITNMEMERWFPAVDKPLFEGKPVDHVAYIQCVGSRGESGLPECSRYCCQAAIKQAIDLRKMGVQVTIFNRDIRVYHHEAETMYREAREQGVTFVRFTPDNQPKLVGKDRLKSIQFFDSTLQADIEIPVDLLVLSVGMRPPGQSLERIQKFIKVPLGMDGYLLEKHPKFGPVETNIQGVFICGCVQGPKDIADSIAQSNAVAAKVDALLSRSTIWMEPITSYVQEDMCRGCGTCIDVCEYGAITLKESRGAEIAYVNEALCEGCGTCSTYCPTGAIDIHHFRDKQIESMLEAFLLTSRMA
jgi:heterodisulfide reductase subunit A